MFFRKIGFNVSRHSNFSFIVFSIFIFLQVIIAGQVVILDNMGLESYLILRNLFFGLLVACIFFTLSYSNVFSDAAAEHTKFTDVDPLLIVRTVACIAVLLQHSFGIVFAPYNLKETVFSYNLWIFMGPSWFGVWIFFVLSGYLMCKGFTEKRYVFNRQGVIGFYRNRLLKIYPLYILALVVPSIILTPDIFKKDNIWAFISMLFFDYNGDKLFNLNPNGPLWSIATEVQFYIICPFIYNIISKSRFLNNLTGAISVFLILICYGLFYRQINGISGGYYWKSACMTSFLGNLDLFCGGMLLSVILKKFRLPRMPSIMATGIIIFIYLCGAFFVSEILIGKDYLWAFGFFGPTIVLMFTVIVILIYETYYINGFKLDKFSSFLAYKTQTFGTLTYAIYVTHEPIIRIVNKITGIVEFHLWQTIILVLGCFVINYISGRYAYLYVETYFNKYRYSSGA